MKTQRRETSPEDSSTERAELAAQDEPSSEAKELAQLRERHLRLAADYDNFRKRTAQEADRRAAGQKEAFILELLSVIDNLERALATDASASPEQLRHGVHLTLQQLRELLRRHGIEHEESLGQSFDPHRHEAIRVGHDPTLPDHSVLEVIQRGYRRGEAVFRPAKVVVNDLSQPDEAGPANHAG